MLDFRIKIKNDALLIAAKYETIIKNGDFTSKSQMIRVSLIFSVIIDFCFTAIKSNFGI